MTFLTGLSVLTREILKNNVHFCCAVQSTEWDVLLCTSQQPFPTSHVRLQYSLLNRYSTFGWLNCVGRDTWGKNSACYQWAGPWLCNVQNWLRVSLLCLILSFLASKTVSTRTTRTPAFWGYPPSPRDYPYYWPVRFESQVHTIDQFISDPKSKEGESRKN